MTHRPATVHAHEENRTPMTPTYDFHDQVALVTGAASGMGLATARAFAEPAPQSSWPTSTRRPSSARPKN